MSDMRKVKRHERIKAMAKLWQTYPDAKLGWCGSHFMESGYLCAGVMSFKNHDLNGRYIWLDKNIEIVKTGKEIDGCIEAYS
jgi:hypothetical protein